MRLQMIIALLVAFGLGVLAGRCTGPTARAQDKAADDRYAEMLHVGVVVKDLDQAVASWKAMGFSDIRVSPPNKGKWPEGQTRWGTFHYVQDPKGGAIVEFI
jgi:hypothetical protein